MNEIHEASPAENRFAGAKPGKPDSTNQSDCYPDGVCECSVNHIRVVLTANGRESKRE